MKKLVFGTTNQGKLKEAREILEMEVEGASYDIDEIQSLDSKEVAIKKAKSFCLRVGEPLFIEDVSLTFNALVDLPGTFIDYFSKSLGNKGLIELLTGFDDRSAVAKTTIVYIESEDNYEVFEGITKGKISEVQKGDDGFGWDPIFVPDGETKTFAEIKSEEKNKYSMRRKALEKFRDWLSNK